MLNITAKREMHLIVTVPIVITLATVASLRGVTRVGGPRAGSEGKKIFNARCSICHGADGRGNTPEGRKLKARDLRAPVVQNQSDGLLMKTVMHGMGKMPGFEKKLNADKIQQVLAYIREFGQKE